MPGLTGQGDTFGLPNFIGELFAVTPTDTPFLSAMGGLTGGQPADSTLFPWSGYDLRDADDSRQRLEGADAQAAENRVRFNVTNVAEIHQETLEVSYSKLSATGQYASTGSANPNSVGVNGSNAVLNELGWQTTQALIQVARDVEASFIRGKFSNPSTNATPRKTRGILEATATNVSDSGNLIGGGGAAMADTGIFSEGGHGLAVGDVVALRALTGGAADSFVEDQGYYVSATNFAAGTFSLSASNGGPIIDPATSGTADVYSTASLTESGLLDVMQSAWENGGLMQNDTATLMVGASLKRAVTKIFITDKNYREESRTVGGVAVMTIETDFGTLNVMLNRHMPSTVASIVSLEECAPRFLTVPNKGYMFVEPLAKIGSAERSQIYGEVGLEYGNERKHAKMQGVTL